MGSNILSVINFVSGCIQRVSRPRMQKSHSYQEYGHNMGRETDVSIAKLVSRELRNHWYEYISLPLKCRLYSQILKWSRFCLLVSKNFLIWTTTEKWSSFFMCSNMDFLSHIGAIFLARVRFLHSWAVCLVWQNARSNLEIFTFRFKSRKWIQIRISQLNFV